MRKWEWRSCWGLDIYRTPSFPGIICFPSVFKMDNVQVNAIEAISGDYRHRGLNTAGKPDGSFSLRGGGVGAKN